MAQWARTTEVLICAAQEQALRTNWVKHHIDKTAPSPLCRFCANYIVSGCEKLAQREYKRRHDIVAKMVHWRLCEKYGLESNERWYEYEPEPAIENDGVTLLWNLNIQCDHNIEATRPDIVVVNKQKKSCLTIDIAIPGDVRVHEKKVEKAEKAVETAKSADCACGCRCTRDCDEETLRTSGKIGGHITNTIFTKKTHIIMDS